MRTFKINQLKIKDWRVFDELEINFNEGITKVFGDNETGKTSVASAITWALNGTSIDGNILQEVLPIYKPLTSVSPKVTLECEVAEGGNTKPVTIEREYKLHLAKDGSYREHTTVVSINGNVLTQAKFKAWIEKNICDTETFNILINSKAFTEQLKPQGKELVWQKQRRIISNLVVDEIASELEMAEGDASFKELAQGINRHESTSELLKSLQNEQSIINKSINSFLNDISTLESLIVDTGLKTSEVESEREKLRISLESLEDKNTKYKAGQSQDERNRLAQELQKLNTEKELVTQQHYDKKLTFDRQVSSKQAELKDFAYKYNTAHNEIETLRKKFANLKAQGLDKVCTACGQDLPEEKIEQQKASVLIEMQKVKQRADVLKAEQAQHLKNHDKCKKELLLLEEDTASVNDDVEFASKQNALVEQIASVTHELSLVGTTQDMPNYIEMKQQLNQQVEENTRKTLALKQNEQVELKIEERENTNKQDLDKKAELEKQIDLCKSFISYRCNIIESKINELFNGITFKMFKMNKGDGELRETFEIYFNDKKYGDDLSYSTKLLVSLEIVKGLQNAFGVKMPIVLDNMESTSFNASQNTDAQIILCEKVKHLCSNCNHPESSRRKINGKWDCLNCGEEFTKPLVIS